MDISNLIIQLQAKVNDLTYNQLAVAKSIELLKTGQVNYADTLAELPSATASNGKMYYIRSLGIYYSNGTSWETIETFNEIIQGFIFSWGSNTRGNLGDNTTVDKSSPVSVVGGFTDWCQISAGFCHSLAVRQNGTLWAWGCNNYGQIGDNTTVSKSSPVSVVGGFTDWCQVSGGNNFSIGLRQNGTVWAWGGAQAGRLGDNTTVSKSSPVSVVGGFTDWCQVSAGNGFSLAIRTNGTAWAWGGNAVGQLGDNTAGAGTSKSSPVSVVGGFTDWCQISAGKDHSLGLRQNGTTWAWGCNLAGQLGDNTTVSKSSPVSIIGGFTDWCGVRGGGRTSFAIRSNGTIWSWGYAGTGGLGDNTLVSKSSPVSVVGGFTDWCYIGPGYSHGLAVRLNGTAWAWGSNICGQLGNNSITTRSSPVSVVGGFCDWCQVAGGLFHSLGIRAKTDS